MIVRHQVLLLFLAQRRMAKKKRRLSVNLSDAHYKLLTEWISFFPWMLISAGMAHFRRKYLQEKIPALCFRIGLLNRAVWPSACDCFVNFLWKAAFALDLLHKHGCQRPNLPRFFWHLVSKKSGYSVWSKLMLPFIFRQSIIGLSLETCCFARGWQGATSCGPCFCMFL